MSGFETDLLTGLAELLVGAGIGAWNPTGAYAATDTGIVFNVIPQSPDTIITLSDYAVSDDPTLSDSVVGVQVRTRCGGQDPRPVMDLDGSIFSALHGLQGVTLSTGVHLVSLVRRSGVPLGQDANNRWMRSANFYATVWRPSTNRT